MPELFLPIAKTVINSAGQPGVTNNARTWTANMLATGQFQTYQIMLDAGCGIKDRAVPLRQTQAAEFDDQGRPLASTVFERYPIVHEIKRIIAKRMKIETPGAGRMNLPAQISPRYFQELTAERLVNGEWIASARRNETWDEGSVRGRPRSIEADARICGLEPCRCGLIRTARTSRRDCARCPANGLRQTA